MLTGTRCVNTSSVKTTQLDGKMSGCRRTYLAPCMNLGEQQTQRNKAACEKK